MLEDCRDQLDILGHTLTLRISRKQIFEATQEKTILTQLRRDCQYISQQVSKLHFELEKNQSFSFLQQVAEEEEQENIENEAKRKLLLKKQTQQRQQEEMQERTETLQDKVRLVKDLKHHLNEQSAKIAIKNNIVELTETERSHAAKLLRDQVELLTKQLKEETKVHKESEQFLQNRYQEQLQQWQQCTNQLLQEKQQRLNSLHCQSAIHLDRQMEMREKLREMQQVVMEDREEQEKLLQQQVEVKAATKLQAWWRGCMFRWGLGSLPVKEEPKKGKKKGNKG